ncbi:hypothetical protein [Rhodococcus sp. SJ-3]|uniref:hypothetical protein n=1 Tax=Rhodococcus sp. SJ-3 TaxID=3454628 RepID=UPI003F78CB78
MPDAAAPVSLEPEDAARSLELEADEFEPETPVSNAEERSAESVAEEETPALAESDDEALLLESDAEEDAPTEADEPLSLADPYDESELLEPDES